MSYEWHDFLGNLGVAMILWCYLLLQLQRLDVSAVSYSLYNGIGAALIIVSLVIDFNLSSFIIEIAWLAISLYGIGRWWYQHRKSSLPG